MCVHRDQSAIRMSPAWESLPGPPNPHSWELGPPGVDEDHHHPPIPPERAPLANRWSRSHNPEACLPHARSHVPVAALLPAVDLPGSVPIPRVLLPGWEGQWIGHFPINGQRRISRSRALGQILLLHFAPDAIARYFEGLRLEFQHNPRLIDVQNRGWATPTRVALVLRGLVK